MPSSPAWSRAGARLARSALAYVAVLAAVVTLAPLDFAAAPSAGWSWLVVPGDLLRNVAFFAPIGFLAALAGPARHALPRAVAMGGGFSLLLEVAQRWLPGRYPSLLDVVANTGGAAIGGIVALAVASGVTTRQGERAIGALGAPLAGLVYLLTPVLWLGTLAGAPDGREAVVLLAGLAGAVLVRAIGVHQLLDTDDDGVPPLSEHLVLGVLAGAWYAVGIAPGLVGGTERLGVGLVAVAAIGALPWIERERRLVTSGARPRRERRFEGRALRQAAPLFLAYLVAASGWPLPDGLEAWRWANGFVAEGAPLDRAAILRVVERVAAFAVLGYAAAEWRSRREETRGALLRAVAGPALGTAVLLEVGRGWHPAWGASPSLAALSVLAALVGAELFRTQRDVIVDLLVASAQAEWRRRQGERLVLREEVEPPTPVTAIVRRGPDGFAA
jgi:VanZ family protein